MNEPERCQHGRCTKRARYEVRALERGFVAFACREHRPDREGGEAWYRIGVEHCPAVMDEGMPCSHAARYLVRRPFSGIDSVCCGSHRPRKVLRTETPTNKPMVIVEDLAKVGA